jgi:diguanylate cyclase (GGDEF)-like protein/PAS domain S-box-containing protein
MEALISNVPGAIYRCSPSVDWAMEYISDEIQVISGYPAEDLIENRARTFASLIHPDDRDLVEERVAEAVARREPFEIEYRILHADGSQRWVFERGRGIIGSDGEVEFLDGAIFDISKRKSAEERLTYLAYHDDLTNLPNRTLLQQHLEMAINRAERGLWEVAVLFVDLDDFKLVNDHLGHAIGDRLLREVAERLRAGTRSGDVLARQGGDEFLAVVTQAAGSGTQDELVQGVAKRIKDALSRPFRIDDAEIYVTASVGASIYPRHGTTCEELLKNADIALYGAKDAGRDTHCVFENATRDPSRALSIASRLRKAIQQDELVLHYQPIVNLRTREPVGAEALIRWRDPDRGLIAPGEFLPVAERTGLIRPITEWVVDEACQQSARWRDAGHDLYVSINLPPVFWQPTAMRGVLATVDTLGLNADRMMIEITEHAAMTDVRDLEPALIELHARGLRLAIDDFGTGHSSLGRLSQMRVSTIKIDRSFVSDLASDPGARVLVDTIIGLATNLGLQPLAEGIETEDQRGYLVRRGCTIGQGFLFSPAVPADQFPFHLASRSQAA